MDQALSILPRVAATDTLLWLAWLVVVAFLPGMAIRRAAGIQPPDRCEQWCLTAILGLLWASWTYWLLALAGLQPWHFLLAILPGLGLLVYWLLAWHFGWDKTASATTLEELRATKTAPDTFSEQAQARTTVPDTFFWVGLVLVAVFVVGYVVRVRAAIAPDAEGVRLYGALYSDKLTNMSPCVALMHGVPPVHLRMSGQPFPYHYFPHLLVAAASRATGVDYTSGFWFYAAALGIAIGGLAVLAFVRYTCRETPGTSAGARLACLGLLYFGLTQFGTEARPLDLSIPMLLLGLVALDRSRTAGRWPWAPLAVLLFGSMPLYEVFQGQAVAVGLIVWWLASGVAALWRRIDRGELFFRTMIAGASLLVAMTATQALTRGAHVVSPARLVFTNSYRESYRDEWLNAVREAGDRPTWTRTVLQWKRGENPGPAGKRELPPELRPHLAQRIAGELIYDAGFVGYVVLRFLNVGLLGLVALVLAWRVRPASWGHLEAISAAVALVGYSLPSVVTWGHMAEGRWWGTPNLYRFPHCACLLLMLLGMGALARGLSQWRRLRWSIPLALAGWQLYLLVVAAFQSPTSFHHVSHERLAALEFLRREVPFGQVVIHPWVDDLIRDRDAPDRVAWVYKRHFTLGSNLAGQQMYYEGREDHLFIGGFIAPEEVLQRRRLRQKFYESPNAATLRAVLDLGGVNWVVADAEHPAPTEVQEEWTLAFQQGQTRVYRGNQRPQPTAVYPAIPMFPNSLIPAP